jgi:hypothetical protein
MPITFTTKARSHLWEWDEDASGRVTAKTVHQVSTSEQTTPNVVAAGCAGTTYPRGSDYPGTSGVLWSQGRSIKPADETRTLWNVESSFDSTNQIQANPLDEPATIGYAVESFEEAYFEDVEGNPAIFTNGLPFSELPKRDNALEVYTITKNVAASTTAASVRALNSKINSDAVTIDGTAYAARRLRVFSPTLSEVKEQNGYSYRVRTITVKAHPVDWDQKFESRGLVEVNTDVGRVPIADPDSHAPVTDPWPLDAEGKSTDTPEEPGFEIVLKPYTAAALATAIL